MNWIKHHLRFIILLLVFLILLCSLYFINLSPEKGRMQYGITFSQEQAIKTGLNWQKMYLTILDGLGVNNVRLIARWDQVETEQNVFEWKDIDWQINEASKRGVSVVLSFGQRVPRWPECFIPEWAKRLEPAEYEIALIDYIEKSTKHYKEFTNIAYWQVENEPFLNSFGFCPKGNYQLLEKEVTIVRKNDSRPIIATDSGELGLWYKAASLGDVFGTTMYRKVWNKNLGYFKWPLPAVSYQLKGRLLAPGKPVYIMELQTEPWGSNFRFITDIPIQEQLTEFNERHLLENIDYAERGGFTDIYLWGAEWWYWLKQKGHPELWDTAKDLWK